MSNFMPGRARCPKCGGSVALTPNHGTFRKHPDYKHPMYGVPGAVRSGQVPTCSGSGRTPPKPRKPVIPV